MDPERSRYSLPSLYQLTCQGCLNERAITIAQKGDTVLLLGKGHETYQEVRGVRSHFSDAEEARAALREKKA